MIADPMTAPFSETTIPASVSNMAVTVSKPNNDRVALLFNFSDTSFPLCVNSNSDDLMALCKKYNRNG